MGGWNKADNLSRNFGKTLEFKILTQYHPEVRKCFEHICSIFGLLEPWMTRLKIFYQTLIKQRTKPISQRSLGKDERGRSSSLPLRAKFFLNEFTFCRNWWFNVPEEYGDLLHWYVDFLKELVNSYYLCSGTNKTMQQATKKNVIFTVKQRLYKIVVYRNHSSMQLLIIQYSSVYPTISGKLVQLKVAFPFKTLGCVSHSHFYWKSMSYLCTILSSLHSVFTFINLVLISYLLQHLFSNIS